jgi:hypothetical protein
MAIFWSIGNCPVLAGRLAIREVLATTSKADECAKLIFSGKRIERENVRICLNFPFTRWNLISFVVRHFGPRENRRKLTELNNYLIDLSNLRWELRTLPRDQVKRIQRVHILGPWVRFNELYVNAVALQRDLTALTDEVRNACQDATERRAWLAFLRACVEVAWLASVFVFGKQNSRDLTEARTLLRSAQFNESYEISMRVVHKMKLAYAKAAVEKAIVYIGASVLGIFAYQTSAGFFIGLILFLALFTALPYYAFRQLFYS